MPESEDGTLIVERDLPYAAAGRPLLWDSYRLAATPADAPSVLLLHGGGWRFGARGMMASAASAFARLGFVALAPDYRLLGEAPWPAPLDDVRRAIDAASGADRSTPPFVVGFSAGAHLALLAAAADPQAVAGIAAFFPPARLDDHHAAALGLEQGADLSPLSPVTHAAHLPPTILFCGDADTMTPPEQSIDLYRAIRAAGGVADLRLYANLIHEFVSLPGMMETTVRDAAAFFDRTARSRPAFDSALAELRTWWESLLARAPGAGA